MPFFKKTFNNFNKVIKFVRKKTTFAKVIKVSLFAISLFTILNSGSVSNAFYEMPKDNAPERKRDSLLIAVHCITYFILGCLGSGK